MSLTRVAAECRFQRGTRNLALMTGFSVFLALATASAKADDNSDDDSPVPAEQSTADEVLPDAAGLLESMAEAMSSLNYQGSFVHSQGTSLTIIEFVHASYP